MLDVVLREVSFRHRDGFSIDAVSVTFRRSTHTAIVGPAACGASTLLRLIEGSLRPDAGDVVMGQRRVNGLKPSHRPLLFATAELDVPGRWSVEHALVAAVRTRSLDREDRHRELQHAATRWELDPLRDRRISSLSSTEQVRVRLARIELLRPAVLVADRLFDGASPAALRSLADEFYRILRIHGTTVISAPASRTELAYTDAIAVLDQGRIIQSGSTAEVFAMPVADAAASATGEFDLIPVTITGTTVHSVIGEWSVSAPPFQGSGVALTRPSDFSIAAAGEDSDLIFGIEEAGFVDGRWMARGLLSGGLSLRVELPREANVHKGRLLPLRYDPARFLLLPRETAHRQTSVPTDVVPPLRETR